MAVMRQFLKEWSVATNGPGLTDITDSIGECVAESGFEQGVVHLSVLHTSASLVVQENASSDVLADLNDFFDRIVPMDNSLYRHTAEGKDDMPAHIKSALTQNHLTLSFVEGRLALGTWQGVFLFEHRLRPHQRRVLAHLLG